MAKAKHTRTHGHSKDFATKQTLNPPDVAKRPPGQTNQPYEQDVERRIGQHQGAGEPPLMKK